MGMSFYSTEENIFSYFQGYDYEIGEAKLEVISNFLTHILEVIANHNEELYEYILNWYASILQKPDFKCGTALVIVGEQGTGKNVFTDILCKLLTRYANSNITNIDSIIGKFNTSIENTKLIVCNEMASIDTNKYLNSDVMKAVITEPTTEVNAKCCQVRKIQNVANLIIVSNNMNPIRIEQDDRRYVVMKVSSEYKNEKEYFTQLLNLPANFYQNLFSFFMTRDISTFDPRKIPQTQAKEEMKQATRSQIEVFIQHRRKFFVDGYPCQQSYNDFVVFCHNNHFSVVSLTTYGTQIKRFCERKRRGLPGREFYYKLLSESLTYFPEEEEETDNDEAFML
jgi:hypothetical protein